MQNIIPKAFINAKVILGILLCLFGCYRAATITWYDKFSGFNYSGLSLTPIFIFIGVLNIKQIDQDLIFKKHKSIRAIMILTRVGLFLYSFINALNKKDPLTLEEMYKIERVHQKQLR